MLCRRFSGSVLLEVAPKLFIFLVSNVVNYFAMQIKFNPGKKFIDKDVLDTRQTLVGMTVGLPIIIYLSFAFAEYEIVSSFQKYGREAQLGMGLWQLVMISMQVGLCIIYTQFKKLIKWYRKFFLVVSVLSLYFGMVVIARRLSTQFYENYQVTHRSEQEISKEVLMNKLFPDKASNFGRRQELLLEESVFTLIGLVSNFLMVLIFKYCGWLNYKDSEKKGEESHFWDLQVYSEWIFRCLFISVLLSLCTIFDNFMLIRQINSFVVGDAFRATQFGAVLVLFGFFTFKKYRIKKFEILDDADDAYIDNLLI